MRSLPVADPGTGPTAQVPDAAAATTDVVGEVVLPALARALEDGDDGVRRAAAVGLAWSGPRALPLLLDLLKRPDVARRRLAADALGELSGDAAAAVPALVEALEDPDGDVRLNAMRTLGTLGPTASAAVPALLETARKYSPSRMLLTAEPAPDDPSTKEAAAMLAALGGIGTTGDEILDLLGEYLGLRSSAVHRSSLVRMAASRALLRLGAVPDSAVHVYSLLAEQPRVSRESLAELGLYCSRSDEAATALAKAMRQSSSRKRRDLYRSMESAAFLGLNDTHLLCLVELALDDENDAVRRAAVDAVRGMRLDPATETSRPVPAHALPVLERAMKDEYAGVRLAAIAALEELDGDGAGAGRVLVEAWPDEDERVREALQSALAWEVERIAPELAPALEKGLDHPDAEVRFQTAFVLGTLSIPVPRALPMLVAGLESDRPQRRLSAASAIERLAGAVEQASPEFVEQLREEAVPALLRMLTGDDDERPHAAEHALESLGPLVREVLPGLEELASGDGEVAASAMRIVTRAKPPAEAFSWLLALLDRRLARLPLDSADIPYDSGEIEYLEDVVACLGSLGAAASAAGPKLAALLERFASFSRLSMEVVVAMSRVGAPARLLAGLVPRLDLDSLREWMPLVGVLYRQGCPTVRYDGSLGTWQNTIRPSVYELYQRASSVPPRFDPATALAAAVDMVCGSCGGPTCADDEEWIVTAMHLVLMVAPYVEEIAPDAVRELAAGLESDCSCRRVVAATALGTLGRKAEPALPALLAGLDRAEALLLENAARAVGGIGDASGAAVPPLIRAFGASTSLESGGPAAAAIRHALEKIAMGGGQAAEVVGLLGDESPVVREAAARALALFVGRAAGRTEGPGDRNALAATAAAVVPESGACPCP